MPQAALSSSELQNPVRQMALFASLGLIFLRYSLIYEVFAQYLGGSSYILYLFAIPSVLGVLGTGGIRRTLSGPPAKYWIAFVVWFLLAVPFSSWRGESASYVLTYVRTDLPMLFILAGLALTWKECQYLLGAIAVGGLCNIAIGRLIAKNFGGRTGLEFGIVSNPNDYAAHLLFILPVILFLLLSPPANLPSPVRAGLRVLGIVGIVVGLFIIMMTGSRGAFIALGTGALFVFWKANARVRIGALIAMPVLFLVLFTALPNSVRSRLQSISLGGADTTQKDDEADESSRLRRSLLQQSIQTTFEHPLFGVGPGQFGNFERKAALWHGTHNSFTQLSSECGIPALLLYLAGTASGFLLLQRTWKQAKLRQKFKDIEAACFCLSLSYIVFCSAIFFLNFAYFFYIPAATGLAIAISSCAQNEFARGDNQRAKAHSTANPPRFTPPPVAIPATVPAQPRRVFRFNGYR